MIGLCAPASVFAKMPGVPSGISIAKFKKVARTMSDQVSGSSLELVTQAKRTSATQSNINDRRIQATLDWSDAIQVNKDSVFLQLRF